MARLSGLRALHSSSRNLAPKRAETAVAITIAYTDLRRRTLSGHIFADRAAGVASVALNIMDVGYRA